MVHTPSPVLPDSCSEMQFYLLQVSVPSRLSLGSTMGHESVAGTGATCGIKCLPDRFYFSLPIVTPLSSSPETPAAAYSHAFSGFWRGMGWFSVFSPAALDFNFLRFSKSVTIHLFSNFQTVMSILPRRKYLKITSIKKM